MGNVRCEITPGGCFIRQLVRRHIGYTSDARKKPLPTAVNSAVYNALARSSLLRDIERSFRDATGLSLKLIRSNDSIVPTPPRRDENPFCVMMATTASTCAACLRVQRELQRRLDHKLTPQQVCCFAGMTDLAVPVVMGGEHVATLLGGQVFQKKPGRQQFDRVLRQVHEWGMRNGVKKLERAYFETPVVSEKKIKAAMRLLSILATQLGEYANQRLLSARNSEPLSVVEARNFVHAHPNERLTLRRISDHVHVSEHYLCKIFKRSTGLTLSEFVARVRVEKAKKLLGDPRLRITDVAEGAGFYSLSQFNRMFRRYAGTSPITYRSSRG
jgi:AraC-like DNA-binding protein/ligand-binding sensor protein